MILFLGEGLTAGRSIDWLPEALRCQHSIFGLSSVASVIAWSFFAVALLSLLLFWRILALVRAF